MSDAVRRRVSIFRPRLHLGRSAFFQSGHFRTFPDTAAVASPAELHAKLGAESARSSLAHRAARARDTVSTFQLRVRLDGSMGVPPMHSSGAADCRKGMGDTPMLRVSHARATKRWNPCDSFDRRRRHLVVVKEHPIAPAEVRETTGGGRHPPATNHRPRRPRRRHSIHFSPAAQVPPPREFRR
jgi:hypothetical protein